MSTETPSPLAAYDVLRFTEAFVGRLTQAEAALESGGEALALERSWLLGALGALRESHARSAAVLEKVRTLPELREVRGDFVSDLQGRWVDALERLHAGIMYHAGARSPVLEGLFPHAKFAALRKLSPEAAGAWALEFERRLKSGYVTRMFQQPEFAFAPPVVEELHRAKSEWMACLAEDAPDEEALKPAREALVKLGATLERQIAQARLLAQAALMPVSGAFEELGLTAKPRRRTSAEPASSPLPSPSDEGTDRDSAARAPH